MDQKKRKNYSPRKLERAINDIQIGKLTPSEASKQYKIPRTTLLYKATGVRPTAISKPGPKCMLGEENEKMITNWLIDCAKRAIPLTKQGLLFTAKKLFQEGHGMNIVSTFDADKGPGRRWLSSFMQRHPELSVRTAEYLHKCRSFATEKSIRRWFTEVTDFLGEESSIFDDGDRVFNCDETSVLLHPKSLPVIAARGQSNVYDLSKSCNKENITILITGNANGLIAPPLALFKFERIPMVISAAAPPNWGIGKSPNGWMTCESFFEYITNVFHPFLIKSQIKLPVILVMDGHKSHSSLQTSEFCAQNGIILIALPPNATHILQPLDVAFFGPMKNSWKKELDLYKLKNGKEIQRHDIPKLVDGILTRVEFKTNLKNGFARCGISPLNPDAVDYSKCFDKQNVNGDQSTTQGDENMSNEAFVHRLENELPASLLDEFRKCSSSSFWNGKIEMKGLFHFWKSITQNEDFQFSLNLDSNIEIDFPEYENVAFHPTNEENAINEENLILSTLENIPIQDEPVLHKDLVFDELVSVGEMAQNDQEPIENDQAETSDKNFTELESIIGHTIECHTEATTPGNDSRIRSKTPSSDCSNSSVQSVEEILNSVVRYNNPSSSKSAVPSFRKKLDLPSVMTSENWMNLKRAADKEKNDIEKLKNDRKEQREKKKEKIRLSKLKLKTTKLKDTTSKATKTQLKRTQFKRNEQVMTVPKEIQVKDWVVVSYPSIKKQRCENFIGQILRVRKGELIAKFLRPTGSTEHSGYIYKYPAVKDVAAFSFTQIKRKLPNPMKFGRRGLLKFIISDKELYSL